MLLKPDILKAWRNFKIGLGLFVVGALLVLGGAPGMAFLQIPGLIFLFVGGLFSAWGYWGILIHRLQSIAGGNKHHN